MKGDFKRIMSINCILTGNKITEHDLADELMLPVQNGGLYINSETTQEDKAEAVEAIKGIGLSAEDVVAPYGFNATNMTLDELLNYTNNWNYPFVCGIQYDSAIAPEVDTCVCIGVKSMLYAFSFIGKIYYCNNAKTGWVEVTDDFLPLNGSVPMSGYSLGLLNNKAKIQASSNGAIQLDSYNTANDENNRRTLILYSKNAADNLNKALRLVTRVDGAVTYYNIYGEHNTNLLATQIQSLIDSGVIEVGGFKSPIKSLLGTATQTAVTGSGKGKLFITADANNYGVTVVIDGVTLLDNADWKNGNLTAEFEFTKSFSLKGESSSYPTHYVAVFY